MTDDLGFRVVGLQTEEEGFEGLLLSRRAGVGRAAGGVETAFVADAYAVPVVVEGVGSYHCL